MIGPKGNKEVRNEQQQFGNDASEHIPFLSYKAMSESKEEKSEQEWSAVSADNHTWEAQGSHTVAGFQLSTRVGEILILSRLEIKYVYCHL